MTVITTTARSDRPQPAAAHVYTMPVVREVPRPPETRFDPRMW